MFIHRKIHICSFMVHFRHLEPETPINACFNWMIPSLYLRNTWKSPFPSVAKKRNGVRFRLEFQAAMGIVFREKLPPSSFSSFSVLQASRLSASPQGHHRIPNNPVGFFHGDCHFIQNMGVEPKIGGLYIKPPKWMVYFHGKAYFLMDDLGVLYPYFWKHPHQTNDVLGRKGGKGRLAHLDSRWSFFVY